MTKPNFFVVGAAKCGTTSLYEYLKVHPEIYLPYVKDRPYFGKDLYPYLTKNEFLNLYNDVSEDVVGDCVAMYLYSRTAAKEIHGFNPNSKIIIMLRNPVDMLYSFHSQMVHSGVEIEKDFEKALKLEKKRKKENRIIDHKKWGLKYLYYSEVMKLSEQISRYIKYFEKKNIHFVIFDDFIKDTEKAYKDILKFLKVKDTNFIPDFGVYNPNKLALSYRFQTNLTHPPDILKKIFRKTIPLQVRYYLIGKITKLNTSYKKREKLSLETKLKYTKQFVTEVTKLEKITKKDLSCWKSSK